ncbi:hypothetical protein [Streptomyces sp. CNQ085]|uniref:hypothetical protein n=1 Tax=Streptomyces sp. CNQ085 TaxID=2886944 RepID=UPI001F50F3A5|nr:hypothetical protein [Streptomyces sp. CNQ085]MCI0384591.1 hypothetical protein [Streptomyces sp. CNQ085]
MTQYLSAEQILGAPDLKTEDVPVPEWGGTVRVQELSGADRDKFESSFVTTSGGQAVAVDSGGLVGFRARLAAASIVDENGKRMFRSDAEVKRLGAKSAAALQRVCEAAMRLSGLTEQDVEELVKA